MIPPKGYLIRYHRDSSEELRRARDDYPDYELSHRFLIYEPGRTNWIFSFGIRLSIAVAQDELEKFNGETDQATAKWTILRWAVEHVEQRLREGSVDSSTEWIRLEAEDFASLRQMAREKNCDYQVKESRDLFCSASFEGDPGRVAKVGLKTLAWTSAHHCQECLMPDREFLCAHLSHPEVELIPAIEQRSPRHAICAKHQPNIKEPAFCYPSGHECWEWIVEAREEDRPVAYASPALAQALDLLDSVWRLRFNKNQGLLKLPSAISIADLERSCTTHEEFIARLIALADVLGAMSIPDGLVNQENIDGSLNRLEAVLRKNISEKSDRDSALAALPVLRAANALRRAAAHGGGTARTDRIRAEQTLRIRFYPDVSWNVVWNQLRARIVEALTTITVVLRKEI